jgi:hypothetical protein
MPWDDKCSPQTEECQNNQGLEIVNVKCQIEYECKDVI